MINEPADRNAAGDLRHRAKVIGVVVGGNQMVDLRETGILDRGHDAIRIAHRRWSPVAGVDEQRLPGRRDEQRGVSTFHVDHVNVERACSAILCGHRSDEQRGNQSRNPDGAKGGDIHGEKLPRCG